MALDLAREYNMSQQQKGKKGKREKSPDSLYGWPLPTYRRTDGKKGKREKIFVAYGHSLRVSKKFQVFWRIFPTNSTQGAMTR